MEFKIVCKCGIPYRFESNLEDGKVPSVINCPSCETDGSALVDALLLAQTAALEIEPHPNGEAMITLRLDCDCGTQIKTDCRPKMKELPSQLRCPGCGSDRTGLANQLLQSTLVVSSRDDEAAFSVEDSIPPLENVHIKTGGRTEGIIPAVLPIIRTNAGKVTRSIGPIFKNTINLNLLLLGVVIAFLRGIAIKTTSLTGRGGKNSEHLSIAVDRVKNMPDKAIPSVFSMTCLLAVLVSIAPGRNGITVDGEVPEDHSELLATQSPGGASAGESSRKISVQSTANTAPKTSVAAKLYIHNDTVRDIRFILRSYVARNGKTYRVNSSWTFKPGEIASVTSDRKYYYASRVDYAIRTKNGDKLWYTTNHNPDKFTVRVRKGDTAMPFRLNHSDIAGLKAGAAKGDPRAMGEMSTFYSTGGCGITVDMRRARILAEKAMRAGDAIGTTTYATLLDLGDGGLKQNLPEAFRLYKRAAELGDRWAQYQVGATYRHGFEGYGVSVNSKEAFKWLLLSARQGESESQFELGVMYYKGVGVGRDLRKALSYYWLAAEQGHHSAINNVGAAYSNGEGGVRKNYTTAISWYHRGAALGNETAVHNLRTHYAYLATCYLGPPSGGSRATDWYNDRNSSGFSGADMLHVARQSHRR